MLIRNARAWPATGVRTAQSEWSGSRRDQAMISSPGTAGGQRPDICDAELPIIDVRVSGGRVAECGPSLKPVSGETCIDAEGCALLPGLHDHHIHLRALAAALTSIRVGPPEVRSAAELQATLAAADSSLPPDAWLRGVGYHESVAGELDRWILDRLLPDRPVRVQHRTGALWMVNSAAIAKLGCCDLAGAERDASGRPTGRLWRLDRWLATRVPGVAPDLAAVSASAAALGVTGFTEATPQMTETDVAALATAVAAGVVAQRVHCMAPAGIASTVSLAAHQGIGRRGHCAAPDDKRRLVGGVDSEKFSIGPVKILLDDDSLPTLDELEMQVRQAHAWGRTVAVHCVTRVQFVLTVAALNAAGRLAGDRVEHGAVIPAEMIAGLRGLTVVTQPHFVAERSEQYAVDVAADDRGDLWRLRSLLDSGVKVAGGTDAPFGGADPWNAMRAATLRSPGLSWHEAISPYWALRLFVGEAAAPGRARHVVPGKPADLILLRCTPAEAVRSLASDLVAATFVAGELVYSKGESISDGLQGDVGPTAEVHSGK